MKRANSPSSSSFARRIILVALLGMSACLDGNPTGPTRVEYEEPPHFGALSTNDEVDAAGADSALSSASVEFVSASSGEASSGNRITLESPAGLAPGDLMIAQLSSLGTARINQVPADWTLLRDDEDGTHSNSHIYWKRAESSEPVSYSWSVNGSSRLAGGIVAYRNVAPTGDPIDAHGGQHNASSTNIVAPSITTTTEGAYLVALFSAASDPRETNLSFTPPSGMAERYDISSKATNGNNRNVAVTHASAPLTTTGATGTRTAVLNAARPGWGQVIALKLAPPPPVVASIIVIPTTHSFTALGQTQQFTATAYDSSGAEVPDVSFTWNSSAEGIVNVDANGLATGEVSGSAEIRARLGDISGAASVTVDQQVATISITPTTYTFTALDQTQLFTATAYDSNDNSVPVESFIWSGTDETVASVAVSGVVTARGPGSAWIRATAGEVSDSATVEVVVAPPAPPAIASISISPETYTFSALAQTQQFTARAYNAQGEVIDTIFTWSSSAPDTAGVDTTGLATAHSIGRAWIIARAGESADSVAVTVAPQVTSITLSPATHSFSALGQLQQFTATARDAQGNVVPGVSFTWSSTAAGVATVGESGLVTAQGGGSAEIRAGAGAVTGTASVTVTIAPPPPPPPPPPSHYTDFGSYPTGQRPSDWSYPYATSSYSVQSVAGTTGGRVLRNSISTNDLHALRWDTPGSLQDVELETVARVTSSNRNDGIGLLARGSGSGASGTFYSTRVDVDAKDFVIRRYVNGTITTLARVPYNFGTNVWVRQKFRVQGNTVRAKFWQHGTPEPEQWSLEAVDTGTPLGAGFVGVFMSRSSSANEYDWVRVTPLDPAAPNQPPVANAGGPYTRAEGSALQFDGSGSSDPDGDALTYTWDFGDGGSGTGPNPTHTYTDNGVYTVVLTVMDSRGASSEPDSTTATITNVAPSVTLSLSAGTAAPGQPVSFNGALADPGVKDAPWAWEIDWGDGTQQSGSVSTQANPLGGSHSYSAVGTYTVRLTVTDKDGGQGSATREVVVSAAPPPPPPASQYTDFGSYPTGQRPSDWSYPYATSSYTVQSVAGTTGGRVLRNSISTNDLHALRWNTPGSPQDVEIETLARVTSSNRNDGIGLLARGSGSGSAGTFYSTRVDVDFREFVIRKHVNGTITTLARVPYGFGTNVWVRQKLRVQGNTVRAKFWQHGTPEPEQWSLEAVDTGTPLGAGFVGVFMSRSSSANEYDWVRVTPLDPAAPNQPPVADFSYEPSGNAALLTDRSTDADGVIVSRFWTFGDGNSSTERNPIHIYATPGVYQVSLTVTDNGGVTGFTQRTVDILPPTAPMLIGAGDIAGCGLEPNTTFAYQNEATAALLDRFPQATVFTAGDNAYPNGTAAQFQNCYHPTWGRHKERTRPALGNHEYDTSASASPYFDYFGDAAGDREKGYYSYGIGNWHIVVLNSGAVGMPAAAQVQWLRDDLAVNTKPCILAYWHHPRFSSVYGDNAHRDVTPLWEALYEAGATLAVVSHDHVYERYAPMNAAGELDLVRGIRQFTVGTGGGRLYDFRSQRPNSEVRNNDTHGIIVFTLAESSYSWKFVPVAGKTFTDSGSESCR